MASIEPGAGRARISIRDLEFFRRLRLGAAGGEETPAPATAPQSTTVPPPLTIADTVFGEGQQSQKVFEDVSSRPVVKREGRRTFLKLGLIAGGLGLAYTFREIMARGKIDLFGAVTVRTPPENFRYSVEMNDWILLLENRESKDTLIKLVTSYGSPKNYNFNYTRTVDIYDNSSWQGTDIARLVESLYPFYEMMKTVAGREAIIKGIEEYPQKLGNKAPTNNVMLERAKASMGKFNAFISTRPAKDLDDISVQGALLDYWSTQSGVPAADYMVIFNRILEISKARSRRQPAVFDADLATKINKYITDHKLGYPLLPVPKASVEEEKAPVSYTRRELFTGKRKA